MLPTELIVYLFIGIAIVTAPTWIPGLPRPLHAVFYVVGGILTAICLISILTSATGNGPFLIG